MEPVVARPAQELASLLVLYVQINDLPWKLCNVVHVCLLDATLDR